MTDKHDVLYGLCFDHTRAPGGSDLLVGVPVKGLTENGFSENPV